MLQHVVPNLKAIHDIFSSIFMSGYHNERELFEKVIAPMREEANSYYEEYLHMFEMLQTHPTPTTIEDAEQLMVVLASFQKDNYSARRDFFEFSQAMTLRLEQRIRNSEFLEHAGLFFFSVLHMLLGQANHQEAIGSRYTGLIAYVNSLRLRKKLEMQQMYLEEEVSEQEHLHREYEDGLKGYCDWNIEQMMMWEKHADSSYFSCKAALVPL